MQKSHLYLLNDVAMVFGNYRPDCITLVRDWQVVF